MPQADEEGCDDEVRRGDQGAVHEARGNSVPEDDVTGTSVCVYRAAWCLSGSLRIWLLRKCGRSSACGEGDGVGG
ncbi:hypothetical protein PI124_g18178 [Phytophthora idaei]|nr:hypothetical protein PI125_g18875 [Phytophthora idaei]KAG3137083.1 hypothetical protein PI126_g17537 [Phytophthora idaei]KAG3236825.1 hypothetical protein PI124_g18178 [Phytophthora idaei]